MYTNGEKVKVLLKINDEDRWVTRIFQGYTIDGAVGVILNSNCQPEYFPKVKVKKFIELSEEDEQKAINQDIPRGLELIQQALNVLIPGQVVERIDNEIFGYGKSLSLEPAIFEQKAIGRIREIPGYRVTIWHETRATRMNPSEMVDESVGVYPTIDEACRQFVNTLFSMNSSDYWENQAEQMMEKWA